MALLTGSRQRGPVGVVKPPEMDAVAVKAACADFKPPKRLSDPEKAIWGELVGLAVAAGTLTAATAMAFADLCTFIVVERQLRESALAAYGSDHRGVIKQVEMLRARFRLVPDGKPVVIDAAPADEWAEFDGPQLVKGA